MSVIQPITPKEKFDAVCDYLFDTLPSLVNGKYTRERVSQGEKQIGIYTKYHSEYRMLFCHGPDLPIKETLMMKIKNCGHNVSLRLRVRRECDMTGSTTEFVYHVKSLPTQPGTGEGMVECLKDVVKGIRAFLAGVEKFPTTEGTDETNA